MAKLGFGIKAKKADYIPGRTWKEIWRSAKTLKRVELAEKESGGIKSNTELGKLKFGNYLNITHRVFINKISKELGLAQPQNSTPYGLASAVLTIVFAIVRWIVTGSPL
jgi:hypothetical protein